jgi:uncharacterized membrane protein
MADNPTFLFVAAYESEQDAHADYEELKDLHAAGLVGTYDAAVVTKSDGKVHVHKHEKPTQHGAWTGLGVGALVGILFPPTVLASGVLGATAGGVVGHFWRGMSRSDVRELGTLLDDGEAALVVIGTSKIEAQVAKALGRAQRRIAKQLDADADDLEQQLAAAGSSIAED